ncbi:MAG: fatty acid amide hydrolase 2 [Myxococcota bacterium]|jgi:fatty acid amide hydrolase 2
MELLELSGVALADLIRRGEVSSREAVTAHIAKIEAVNPTLNAVVADRFEAALSEADQADARRGEDVGPLHGVPCTIKECFALTGMPNASGLVSRAGIRAPSDATAVARLRAAGAIPMGVTNTSELCMWMETSNRLYGRTNNPYDPRRIVGGSSGGEGAIIGAGGSPLGIGSDVGGSIRMPAFFNGIFGHKPTGGLIPNTGQYPAIDTEQGSRYLTTGPLCRRAEDLMPLVRILAGPDGLDPGCFTMPLSDPAQVDFTGVRVLTVPDDGLLSICPELIAAQAAAAAALEARGARIEEIRFSRLRGATDIWSAMLGEASTVPFRTSLYRGQDRTRTALLRWAFGGGSYTLPAILLAGLERVTDAFPARAERFIAEGHALRAEMTEALGIDGLMLYPSHPTPAPRHYVPLSRPISWIYTAILNVMELPVTQVPLGLDGKGMPLGVQVVGAHGADHRTIAAALALEADLGGWVPPWQTKSSR